jgi:hypothetical protein
VPRHGHIDPALAHVLYDYFHKKIASERGNAVCFCLPAHLDQRLAAEGHMGRGGHDCDYEVNAAVHDSQKLDRLLTQSNTSAEVFAGSAYQSEGQLRASCFKSGIHRRTTRNHPLSDAQVKANRKGAGFTLASNTCSHLKETSPGGRIVRTIGIVRARAKIGLQNLAYNIRRLVTVERIAAA